MNNVRRISVVLALAAVPVVAALGWLVPLSRDGQAAPAPSSDASLKGKLLLVNTNNMMTSSFLLEKTNVQKIGDHTFLVGKGAAEGRMGAAYKDRIVRLQMDHIVSITEFDDLKDAQKAMRSGGGSPFGIGGYGAAVEIQSGTATPVQVVPAAPPAPPPLPKAPPPKPARR